MNKEELARAPLAHSRYSAECSQFQIAPNNQPITKPITEVTTISVTVTLTRGPRFSETPPDYSRNSQERFIVTLRRRG